MEILEQVVALQASSILDETPAGDGPSGSGASRVLTREEATVSRVSSTSMKQEDVAIMKDVLQEARSSGSCKYSINMLNKDCLMGCYTSRSGQLAECICVRFLIAIEN